MVEEEDDEPKAIVKVQYPDVASSMGNDYASLRRLQRASHVVTDSLHADWALNVAHEEPVAECDYSREEASQIRYRSLVMRHAAFLGGEGVFYVPEEFPQLISAAIQKFEYIQGEAIYSVEKWVEKPLCDAIGTRMLRFTMDELFVFEFQHSNPYWSDYVYDTAKDLINLIYFGEEREYSRPFLRDCLALIAACAARDHAGVLARSASLGFLTGQESRGRFSTCT